MAKSAGPGVVRESDDGIPIEINVIEELGADGCAYGFSKVRESLTTKLCLILKSLAC